MNTYCIVIIYNFIDLKYFNGKLFVIRVICSHRTPSKGAGEAIHFENITAGYTIYEMFLTLFTYLQTS